MEAKFQTSFIPQNQKDMGVNSSMGPRRSSGGVFYFLSTVIFTLAFLASVGVLGYEYYLRGQIAQMDESLTAAQADLRPDVIAEIVREDARLLAAEMIVNNHTRLSALFSIIEGITLQNVAYSSFSFENAAAGSGDIEIEILGTTQTYSALALQAELFALNSNFVNPQFSDLNLNDRGNVTFSLTTGLRPNAISYVELLESGAITAPSLPGAAPSVTSPTESADTAEQDTPANDPVSTNQPSTS